MVSLTFDDGSKGFWDNARRRSRPRDSRPRSTSRPAGSSRPLDPFLMTPDQITTLAREGNEIGAHSVTHPLLTTLTDAQLATSSAIPRTSSRPFPVSARPQLRLSVRRLRRTRHRRREGGGIPLGALRRGGLHLHARPRALRHPRPEHDPWQTTLAQFKSWIDYAKAHNYWLVIVYHEVVPDSAPGCTNPSRPRPVPRRLRHHGQRLEEPARRHLVGRPRPERRDRAAGARHRRRRDARPGGRHRQDHAGGADHERS